MTSKLESGNAVSEEESVEDLFCDPKNPKVVNFENVCKAAHLIRKGVEHTLCLKSNLSSKLGMEIYLKMEFLQMTGSFKERGARNSVMNLSEDQKKAGVIAASLGNHALALSYVATQLGIPVTVVMPKDASVMKVEKCRGYGANVVLEGKDMTSAKRHALILSKRHGMTYINGYDHPDIIAGQGTIGLEIIEQVPFPIDAVVIPVGGGGLIAGIAVAIKALSPNTKVIGVESEKCNAFSNAMKAGKPVFTPTLPSIADGLAVSNIGVNAFATVQPLLDRMIVVTEEAIALGLLRYVEEEKIVVEGAAASGLAAAMSGQLDEFKGKRVVFLLCGGNIASTTLSHSLERGLASDGRLVRFILKVMGNVNEGITELCSLIVRCNCRVKNLTYERAWMQDIDAFTVTAIVESANAENSESMKAELSKRYDCRIVFNEFSSSDKNTALNHF